MLPSIFEKHKICSNPTKSHLIIQYYQQKKKRILRWNGVLLLDFTIRSAML